MTGTVLFAVHTFGVLGVVASSQAGLGPAKVLTLIGWLIGFGAVVSLWQRPSSAFFHARARSAVKPGGQGRVGSDAEAALLGQRHGVEIADPHQARGQGQPGEDEQGRPG